MANAVKYNKINEDEEAVVENGLISESDNESSSDKDLNLLHKKERIRFMRNRRFRLSFCCSRGQCSLASFVTVVIGLSLFAAAIAISFILSRILNEPKGAPQYNAGVASDVPICSYMAGSTLEQGGSAVDAAITAMLCVGVVNPESSGIGGGGFMVVYEPSNQSTMAVDFRESAPYTATPNMFDGDPQLSIFGGLAVAVPGELAGMKKAHDMFGKLSWKQLFDPVVNLSRHGFEMTSHNYFAVNSRKDSFPTDSLFYSWYLNEDGSLKKQGDLIQRVEFASALELIRDNGIDEFYNGTIAKEIVKEVQDSGGILTLKDMMNYEPLVLDPVSINISNNLELLTPPIPSGGPQFLYIMALLDMIAEDGRIKDNNQTQQHMVESFKYSFAARSNLGDPWCTECDREALMYIQNQQLLNKDYVKRVNESISEYRTYDIDHYNSSYIVQDHGTTHISIIGPDGMAVSVTTTVNTYFGSKLITPVSGIVLNNQMDDFSSPNITNFFGLSPSEANFIKPGKRPLSSTCPVIALEWDKERKGPPFVRLVSGGAGGSHIITANAQAVMRGLYFNEDIVSAIEDKRLHHQLVPNVLFYENDYPGNTLKYLEDLGHKTSLDNFFCCNSANNGGQCYQECFGSFRSKKTRKIIHKLYYMSIIIIIIICEEEKKTNFISSLLLF